MSTIQNKNDFVLIENSVKHRTSPTSSCYSSQNPVSQSEDICLIKMLNKGKFPVFLAYSRIHTRYYAMKVFPSDNGNSNRYFENEIRFSFLRHPNVINIVDTQTMVETSGGIRSYILMDYAPHGDFFDFISKFNIQDDEKLIRTYFRQLIQGIEYLHNQGVAHLDIKPENLLLGENYVLKVIDFDASYLKGDRQILSRGTSCYRAPEVITGRCINYKAADIYSAGVILFIMKSGGIMPHYENNLVKGINYFELLYTDNKRFWEEHARFQKSNLSQRFNPEFKELFNAMTAYKPGDRATLQQIKESKWYKGETYSNEELVEIMEGYL